MTSFPGKLAAAALVAALLAIMAPFLPAVAPVALADGQNLLKNGTFEDNDGTVPTDWTADCYDHEEGFSVFTMDPTGGTDGGAAACIENAELNDARFMQEVTVEKGKLYRLSGDIKVSGAESEWGANLSFMDTFVHTEPLFDTHDRWQHVELYARAGDNQTKATVYVRLGGYSAVSHGKAEFDNIVLEEVSSVPQGAVEKSMATNKPASSSNNASQDGNKTLPYIIFVTLLFAAFLFYCFKRMRGEGNELEQKKHDVQFLVLAAAAAFLVRLVFALAITGYDNDIACWMGWSNQAATGGLFHLYSAGGFNDYPPGYMYVLWVVGKINLILPSSQLQVLMCKMPSILADLATGYVIYRMALKRINPREAALLALLYVFNPLVILDSSAWGQIDSILALIIVGCIWQIYRGRMWQAAAIYGIGLLVKPQMLLFAPLMLGAMAVKNAAEYATESNKGFLGLVELLGVGVPLGALALLLTGLAGSTDAGVGILLLRALFAAAGILLLDFAVILVLWLASPKFKEFLKDGNFWAAYWKNRAKDLLTIGAGLVAFLIPALPFWIVKGDPAWLPGQYLNALGTYKGATVNACNLLALFGGNWVDDTQKIFGVPYFIWGYLGMAVVCLFTLYLMIFRDKSNRRIFLWGAVLISGLFVLGLRMHERYMYPAVALLLVYYILEKDRRALYLFGFFSVTQFLNTAIVLANKHMSTDVFRVGDLFAMPNPDGPAFWVTLISLAAVISYIYMVFAARRADKPLLSDLPDAEENRANKLDRIARDLSVPKAASRLKLSKKDWLLMGGLTLVYAVVAVAYLGTTQVPKTMWPALHTGDYAVIDLGKQWQVGEIWHYDSLTKGNLQISTSDDGQTWTDQIAFKHKATGAGENDDLGIYKWTIDTTSFEARYVKLTVTAPPVRLLEIVFKDATGNIIKPSGVTDASGDGKDAAANLIDEPQMTPDRPSFYNGTYFDEIYHARTGWEFTQGLMPYENTHPPLGKDIIALGILIFGMDPFGWRIMGTLMGILMVPAMYLFGLAIFRRTRYAFITSFLMTFDFMHFVQTRIATIDSYGVLFIILTFLCMYLYLHTNYNTQKLRHTFAPLALSGLFFALASASKWIGLYAGAGLAVMFFYSLYRRWKEYDAVRYGDVEVDEETREKVLKGFWKKTVLTILWCALFFVVIAAVIYFASYIPFNIGSGGDVKYWDDFKFAWDNQSSMYNYHSTLVDNHFFKSPWYCWPFMIKPMWFYKADYLQPGWMGSIATFGNPAVWWAGTAAMIWLLVRLFRNRRFKLPDAFLLVAFLTEFLPWVLVSRTMFIYHYFASVPFFVLAIVMYIRDWEKNDPVRKHKTYIYLAIVLALFILFYPVLSGLPIPSWYGALLKWMPTWYFTY